MDDNFKSKGLLQELHKSFFGINNAGIKSNTLLIAIMGVLIALNIVFERVVYIPVGDTSRYSLVFVIIVISCISLGALKGAIVAVLADVIGSFMLYGSACPLITLVVFISALSWGMFLYEKRGVFRILLAVLFDQLVCSLTLKTGALAIWYYGGMSSYTKVLATRIPQIIIMIPLEFIVLVVLDRYLFGYIKKIMKDIGL
jgi:ECF transporter S component (folate family)